MLFSIAAFLAAGYRLSPLPLAVAILFYNFPQ